MKQMDFTVTEVPLAYYRKHSKGYSLVVKGRHKHGLTLIIKGELEMTIQGKVICATPGDIILQRQGDEYRLDARGDAGVEYVVITYSVDRERELLDVLPDRLFSSEHLGRYRHAFENAARVFGSYNICEKPLLCALVQEIMCNIINDCYSYSSVSSNPVEYAKRYIEQYYGCDLSADNIAAVVGLSPSYLRTLFQKSENESPIHYLNRIRIERAKEMLSSRMFSLGEVASACGFKNVYYFNRVFKSFTGTPPGKY